MATQTLVNQAVRRLVDAFAPQRIIVFGSQASGTADERSDVDLLVIQPLPADGPTRRELTTAMYRTLRGVGIACDLIVMTPQEFELERQIPGSIARPASREGEVVYERAA